MKKVKSGYLLIIVMVLVVLSGCTGKDMEQETETKKTSADLYIGYDSIGYKTYAVELEGEMSPEKLITAIEDLTGWDLSLHDEVSQGKGGMTVNFAKDSALITGPPTEQKEEFRVYDVTTFTKMVLDSIKETLQNSYVTEEGNPDELAIFYSVEDHNIEIDGIEISMETPWNSENFK